MVGYNAGNNNNRKRTLTTSPALAAQHYVVGEAGDDRKVSIAN